MDNRYSCIIIPDNIDKNCKYFEIESYDNNIKEIITKINKKYKLKLDINLSKINDNFGIFLWEDLKNNSENEYFNNISKKYNLNCKTYNTSVIITHKSNFNAFIKKYNLESNEIEKDDFLFKCCGEHNLCYKLLLLSIKFFVQEWC